MRPSFAPLPAHLERKIARRWREWLPWVVMEARRKSSLPDQGGIARDVERAREQHAEHVLAILDAGIAMRLIRRHRLDDPRLSDECRGLLFEAAIERRRTAWRARHRGQTTSLSDLDRHAYE
jgi:hypothetical protein